MAGKHDLYKAELDHVGRATVAASSDDLPMDTVIRTYRFEMTISVEPDHIAYGDPEWAADAAHGALTTDYGIECEYAFPLSVDSE